MTDNLDYNTNGIHTVEVDGTSADPVHSFTVLDAVDEWNM
jgi:hypothetical protein